MPYYSAGDYYRGDYYRGDGRNYAAGGLFGVIGKGLKAVGRLVGGAVKATPVGQAITAAFPTMNTPTITGFAPPIVPKPGIRGFAERLVPGGESGYMVAKRRRMNVTNVKALRRAGRRVRGFLKIASRLGALPVSRSPRGKLFKRKGRR